MKKTKFTEAQIIGILNEQEQGIKVAELKRLRELEQENARLKKIIANQSLDIDIMKDMISKKW